ncbi:hypothetical protein [Sorangium sp. So ce1153]|uniref:hypothetical protein n=1 Tax=Sorangium sp. So ce1153 TaxID=3133333 RepID=UPI003F5F804B
MRSHRAAVAPSVATYNLTRAHASLRASPAMAAGLVAELWSVEDLVRAALAEPAAAPLVPQALTLPAQTGPVRQLPGGLAAARLGWVGPVSARGVATTARGARGSRAGTGAAAFRAAALAAAMRMVQLSLFET